MEISIHRIQQNYQFNDATPLTGQNFYRLAQLDVDNKATYSPVVSLKFLRRGFYFITNNPGHGLYNLNVDGTGNEKISYSVIDANGRRIMSKILNGSGDQTIDITNYSSGIYLLQIQKGKRFIYRKVNQIITMQIHENSRRNFISNIAILSAGTAFKPAISHLPSVNEKEDLQKKMGIVLEKIRWSKVLYFI